MILVFLDATPNFRLQVGSQNEEFPPPYFNTGTENFRCFIGAVGYLQKLKFCAREQQLVAAAGQAMIRHYNYLLFHYSLMTGMNILHSYWATAVLGKVAQYTDVVGRLFA
jgi:hypothetical protein